MNLAARGMPATIGDGEWQNFQERGYLRLGPVVSGEELQGLRGRIDRIMMGEASVPYGRMMMQLDTSSGLYKDMDPQTMGHKGATLAYRKIQGLEFDPLFLAYMQKPLFRHLCARAYGEAAPVSVFRAMFMNKPAGQGTVLPWHRDFFGQMDRPPRITAWLALDGATRENGCIEVLEGSHRFFPAGDTTVFPDEERTAEILAEHKNEALECPAGHAILLHNNMLHTSAVNPTGSPRRAFSVCYMDGRARAKNGAAFSRVFGPGALRPDLATNRPG